MPFHSATRSAEPAFSIAEAEQAVLAPAIGAAAGLIVGKVIPGIAVGAIVLADGPPVPLGEVGAPVLPVAAGDAVAEVGGARRCSAGRAGARSDSPSGETGGDLGVRRRTAGGSPGPTAPRIRQRGVCLVGLRRRKLSSVRAEHVSGKV